MQSATPGLVGENGIKKKVKNS